ncbi:MAG: NADH-quinone oxidoreductase subunit A [Verrucomicrobiota bacterium]|nr:MAG: NADH-quinone oxidoreductase subunit A [Verrucomicrobiota bacterium]
MPSGLLSTLNIVPILASATDEPYSAYLLLGVMILLAAGFACAPLILSAILAPKKPGEIKESTFECGLESKGDPWVQFKVQYYLYALAFVIFDIEVIFLYPWAVGFTGVSFGAFLAMGIFILLLAESLIYLWIKGVLTWK